MELQQPRRLSPGYHRWLRGDGDSRGGGRGGVGVLDDACALHKLCSNVLMWHKSNWAAQWRSACMHNTCAG